MDQDEKRATKIINKNGRPRWTYGSIEGMGKCCYDDNKPMGNFYVIEYDTNGYLVAIKWDNLSELEKDFHTNYVIHLMREKKNLSSY